MTNPTAKKRRNRKVLQIRRHIRATMSELESENGPCDFAATQRFLAVGEHGLAMDYLEHEIDEQDLVIVKSAQDAISSAKRLMGHYKSEESAG